MLSLAVWIAWFAIISLGYRWIVRWGGAEWLEGWKSAFAISPLASKWQAKGIKLYAFMTWVICAVWFVVGLFLPGARLYTL